MKKGKVKNKKFFFIYIHIWGKNKIKKTIKKLRIKKKY